MPPLQRLEHLDPRTQWPDEAADFTPWVSSPEGLQLIGDTLNLELETLSSNSEVQVGSFRADVVCVDTSDPDNSLVLIENQLAPTDHNHVGQVLTYAAGLDAVTIIWIASKFRDEHLAVVDWLNQITNERYRFFGLEIELVRIGNSNPAAVFSVAAKPNDWSRGLRQRTDSDLARSRIDGLHEEYWTELCSYLEESNANVSVGKPWRGNWIGSQFGTTNAWLNAVRLRRPSLLRVEVHFRGKFQSAYFAALFDQKDEIETELGFELTWERSRGYVIAHMDPMDVDNWPDQTKWFADTLQKFNRAFRHRIDAVDPAEWSA